MIEYTAHAKLVVAERDIDQAWVEITLTEPDNTEYGGDGNTHYIRSIMENGNRILRVVVNENVEPHRIVTVFFDRRLR